jgi:hypothetical protein
VSLDDDIRRLRFDAMKVASKARAVVARAIRRFVLSKRLFRDAKGELTPEAIEWGDLLAKRYHVTRPAFHADPYISAYREGQRSVVLDVLNMMRLDPAKLDRARRQLAEVMDDD